MCKALKAAATCTCTHKLLQTTKVPSLSKLEGLSLTSTSLLFNSKHMFERCASIKMRVCDPWCFMTMPLGHGRLISFSSYLRDGLYLLGDYGFMPTSRCPVFLHGV